MKKEYIIPIFIPHGGCKRQCVFCNEYAATGLKEFPERHKLEEEYNKYKQYFPEKNNIYIAFYGSTFTALKEKEMKYYLDWADEKIKKNEIKGIRFSTSPEEINYEKIKILNDYKISVIEIGVQSFFDDVLKHSNRSHNVKDIFNAIDILDKNNYSYGLHLMTGLPKSTFEKEIKSAEILSKTNAKFARIHPTVVLKGSILEEYEKNNKYNPESLEEAIKKTSKMTIKIEKENIKVIRLGLCLYGKEINNVYSGPYHKSFGDLVRTNINRYILTYLKDDLKIPKSMKSQFIGFKKRNKDLINENIFYDGICIKYKNKSISLADIYKIIDKKIED
ncbi:MAG: hypothetical protein PWP28_1980 [Oceanotoga sp.]|jgi:histone acetyltransferase (RNA polymerase elongator complex component)|uniref:Radical SAM family protein n=1 Tax=Oceanotoga teriensis TaxID=515440 RepID=A0AA45HIB4_9BACT|nr:MULTISPECIES: radical SAM protein [Oceanotoga]MDN5343105.1 hypothetical protein [Oceanotoga sp.]PWJ91222.1 radical SAM family protein [Oceanotoga teriensis]